MTIDQSYAQIAKEFDLGEGNTETMKNMAQRWIGSLTDEWLIIFDDLMGDNPGKLPGRGKGNIIYTSRTSKFSKDLSADCVVQVTEMSDEEAVDLLLKAASYSPSSRNGEEVDTAKAIVAELGRLPLAIDHAAAYIREDVGGESYTLRKYLEELRTKQVRLFENPRFTEEKPENATVYATLELSYDAILTTRRRKGRTYEGRQALAALNVLNLLCFYHHERFSLATLIRATKERHNKNAHVVYPLSRITNDPERNLDEIFWVQIDGKCNIGWFMAGIQILRQFSLVRIDDEIFTSMHVLVRNWAQHRMDKKTLEQQRLMAMIILNESIIPSLTVSNKIHLHSLLPHVNSCFTEEPLLLHHDGYKAHLCYKMGWFYSIQKDFWEAERWYLASLRLLRLEFGNEDWQTINCIISIAMLYHDAWFVGPAEQWWLEAIERVRNRKDIVREALGLPRGSLDLGDAEKTEKLSRVKRLTKRLTTKSMGRRATNFKYPGDKHDAKQPSLRLLAGIGKEPTTALNGQLPTEQSEGQSPDTVDDAIQTSPEEQQALKALEEAAAREKRAGIRLDDLDDLEITIHIFHLELARVHMDQGRYGMGKRVFLQGVNFLKELVPEDEPAMIYYNNEAENLQGNKDVEWWTQRLEYMCDVAAKNEKVWDFEETYRLVDMVAHAKLVNHDWDAALRDFSRALRYYETIHGRRDRRCLEVLRSITACLTFAGKLDSAVKISRIALERAKAGYGKWHIETIRCLSCLARAIFLRDTESSEETIALLEEAAETAELLLGASHNETKSAKSHLNDHRRDLGLFAVEGFRFNSEGKSIEVLYEEMKQEVENLRAVVGGKESPFVKRYEALIAGGPPKTQEELLERSRACMGSNSRAARRVEHQIEERKQRELAADTDSEDDEEYFSEAYIRSASPEGEQATEESYARKGKGIAVQGLVSGFGEAEGSTRDTEVLDDDFVVSVSTVPEDDGQPSTSASGSNWQQDSSLKVSPMRWKGGYRVRVY